MTGLTTNETSQPKVSALPDAWITRIFATMAGLYGSRFADLWAGTDLTIMKALWAGKLAGFIDRPDVIKAALAACEERETAPNLPQFLAMCRTAANASRKPAERLMLAAPNIAPEVVAERKKKLFDFASKFGKGMGRPITDEE